ncbi:MAG: thiol reductant ABC exporter subunit CydD [Coriobacteriia bacterium]|nr:thiol reductant ABC exporter subunit CydD [Coriobacteriia bacterium]MCL2750376.1 thiol reductant ABC exporter subunit CydD [Coriobacteriia bacterium]
MLDKALFELPGIKRILIALAVFAAFEALVILGLAWGLSSAVTNLWLGHPTTEQLLWIVLFFLSFVGIQIVRYAKDKMLDTYAFERADELRQDLMHSIFSRGSSLVQEQGSGTTTTLLLEGIEQVEIYLRLVLSKMVRLFVIPFFLLIPIFILDWVSGIIMLLIFPFVILYMVILGRFAGEKATKQHKEFKRLANHFVDTLRGIDTLKFFGLSKKQGDSIYAVSERYRGATIKTLRVAILSSSVLDLFATLSVAAVAIMLGLRLLDESIILFPALTVLILAPEYFKTIREFAADFHASLDGKNSLASIQKILLKTEESEDASVDALLNDSRHLLWSESSELAVNDLSYLYDEFEAVSKVSFAVLGPVKVGIIGASGAGKSSLIHLLGGFSLASEGSICINNTELTGANREEWQQQLAYLPQNPYIFHATLSENISFYHPGATEEEVLQAAQVVGLQDLIDELPEGLNTKIGEGARPLSGGQAQRVALARICLDKKRSVLLFDEPTAHLDIETELELKQKMLPLMQDKLVLFATHRLHWMHDMDLIIVLDEGRIVESGTLEELQKSSSTFASFVSKLGGGAA